MDIPLDEVLHFDCVTHHPTTGAVTDADSTPTFAVYEEATDTDIGIGGNLTKRTSLTGNYRGTFTASAANGFEVGKWYSIIASATVNAIAGKAVVKNFRVVANETVAGVPEVDVTHVAGTAQTARDLGATLGAAGAGLTDLGGMSTTMKAQVQTECDDALVGQNLDHLVKIAVDTDLPTTVNLNSVLGYLMDAGVSWSYNRSNHSLEGLLSGIPDGVDAQLVIYGLNTISSRIPAALTAGGNIKADIQGINSNTGGAAALDRAARAITIGTVGAASTTTSIVTSSITPAAAVGDQFKGLILKFDKDTTTANLRGQGTDITASTAGGILTCTALTTAPVSGDTFTIE